MRKELTIEDRKKLCDEMPYLIPRHPYTGKIMKDYNYSFVEGEYDLPSGWFKLFLQMCRDIRQPLIDSGLIDTFRFVQIKEKYNVMRCYVVNTSEEVDRIIQKYEYLSQFLCHKCGKLATKETFGWIVSFCDDCLPENMEAEDINFDPIMKLVRYTNGNREEVEVDCSDEWNRLFENEKEIMVYVIHE